MSDIIIEGKNLSDINQSNFQTVGVRSGFHFITDPNVTLSADESVFKYDVLKIHRTRLGDDYTNVLLPTELLEFVTIEPWQGRLHYDKDFSDITQLNLLNGFSWDDSWQPRNQDAIFKMRIPEFITYPNNLYMDDRVIVTSDNFISLYYPYFYTGNIYSTDDVINIFSANDITKYKVNDSFGRYNNFLSKGFEQRTNDAFIVKDERFPLGTYTEENKKHWEIQTSDLITRESQFSQTRMQTAQSSKIEESQLIKSEEEEFSVDAFAFTEREGVITPLCFYYDKNLHSIEYNNASTGKINMKVELRESGRNGFNEIDLYQERKVVRPFLMGFEKDEQPNGGTNPLTDESLIGTGTVYGEGLYYADTRITLTSLPDANSYLLGIFDIPDNNSVSTTSNYTFMMPSQDIQYLTKFRPNPYIIMRQRFTDQFGNETIGGAESKGEIRLWQSKLLYNNVEDKYFTVHLDHVGGYGVGNVMPNFKTGGSRFFKDTFRPFDFDGEPITIEQREITDNYKFKGFTYLSGSDNPQEVPFPSEPIQIQTTGPDGATVTVNADQAYDGYPYGSPGNDESAIKTIKLLEDFYYPAGRLNIYANYGLILFHIENLNNNVDFENNFAEALKYGPFKFATALGDQLGGIPNVDDYRFDDITSFPAYTFDEPNVRLYIAGPGMGYANAEFLSESHITSLEDQGFDFGSFVWHKEQFEEVPIEKESNLPNTIQTAIELSGQEPSTYVNGQNNTVSGNEYSPSPNYNEGDTEGPGDIFIVTDVQQNENSDPYDGYYEWDVTWGPNLSDSQLNDPNSPYDLNNNEFEFKGIELKGDIDDDNLLTSFEINQIISTETTSSISYQPLQRGTYVKAFDDGIISTFVEKSVINSMIPIRPANLSGAIDADMYGFGHQVQYNMTPSQASMPPQISAFVAQENGDLTNSTNIHPTLDLERLGVSIGDWNENGGGNFTYTVPESRDATYMAGDNEISLFWKYIEFRIVVQETAEGEQSESGELVDPNFYVGLNIFAGSGTNVYNDENGDLISSGGLVNLFNKEEMVDENGIIYQEFSDIPLADRTIALRVTRQLIGGGEEGYESGEEPTASFLADPGQNPDDMGIITQALGNIPNPITGKKDLFVFVRFNQEGNITIQLSSNTGDEGGGGF